MNKDLYLVRHGQTIFNLKRIIQGWSDSPLTQLGCDQAARAGMFLRARGIEPDHAYTSTLHRTEQTIANLWPGLAYERLDGLREWFFGDFEAERVMLMPERPWRDFYRQFGGEGQISATASNSGAKLNVGFPSKPSPFWIEIAEPDAATKSRAT